MEKSLKWVCVCLFIAIIVIVALVIQTRYNEEIKYSIKEQEREIEFISREMDMVTIPPTSTPKPVAEKPLRDCSIAYKLRYIQVKYPEIMVMPYQQPNQKLLGAEGCFNVASFEQADKLYDLANGYISYYKINDNCQSLKVENIHFHSTFEEFDIEYLDKENNNTIYLEVADKIYLSTKDWTSIIKDGVEYLVNEKVSKVSGKVFTFIRYDWNDKEILLCVNDKVTNVILDRYTELILVEFNKDQKSKQQDSEKIYDKDTLDNLLKDNPDIKYHKHNKELEFGSFEGIKTLEAYQEIMRDILQKEGYYYYDDMELSIQRFDVLYDGQSIELIYKLQDKYYNLRIIEDECYRFPSKISGSKHTDYYDWGVIEIGSTKYYYHTYYNKSNLSSSIYWEKDKLIFEFHTEGKIDEKVIKKIISQISYNEF